MANSGVTTDRRWKIMLTAAALLAAIMLALLVREPMSVERQKALCVINVRLASHARLLLNCDSSEFLQLGYNPSGLLEPGNARQSRPLFVEMAHVLSYAFLPIAKVLAPLLPADPGENARNADKVAFGMRNMLPIFMAYLTMNLTTLLASVWLAVRLLPKPILNSTAAWVALAGLLPLLSNDVVKAFVWSAHTQMLNILVPLIATTVLMRPLSKTGGLLLAVIAGLGMLVYGNMAILLATFGLSLLQRAWTGRLRWASAIAQGLIAGVIFAAPSLLWAAWVKAQIGSYNVIEMTKYHEFIWIIENARIGVGALAVAVADMAWFFISNALCYALPAAIFIGYAAWRSGQGGAQTRTAWWDVVRPLWQPAMLVTLLSLGFFIALGWRAERLAFAAIPPLLLLAASTLGAAALTLGERWTRRDNLFVAAIALAQIVYVVVKDGPWS